MQNKLTQQRSFSAAAFNVKSKFEQAYAAKKERLDAVPEEIPAPKDQKYARGYHASILDKAKVGYVHPYHAEESPIYMSSSYVVNLIQKAAGPEQVSPHYESLSRSRRGLLFLFGYTASITTILQCGGWETNDWVKGMLFQHEFLIAFYIGFTEMRHFTYLIGPKFTIFYSVYSQYELIQFANQWADKIELVQNDHLRHTREQLEYSGLDKEYTFVKNRALVNFLTNQKLAAEAAFHNRSVNMLNQISNFEQANLRNQLRGLVVGSVDEVFARVDDPAYSATIQRGAFESALNGIRAGVMTYEADPILPMIQEEMAGKLSQFQGLSAAEESALLSLTPEQKASVVASDRQQKNEFLAAAPAVSHGTLKVTEKYKDYMSMVQGATRA